MTHDNFYYKFNNFTLLPKEGLLLQNKEVVPLTNRSFNVLLLLVDNQGKIVQKQEFLDKVWADSYVEEGNLAVAINTLRKVLHSVGENKLLIETFSRRGYRFNGNVEKISINTVKPQESVEAAKVDEAKFKTESQQTKSPVIGTISKNYVSNAVEFLKNRKFVLVLLILAFLSYGFKFYGLETQVSAQKTPAATNRNATKISIEVLPFVNLNPTIENRNFEFAFADSIMFEIAKMKDFSVVTSISTGKYLDRIPVPDELKLESDAEYVLAGSFLKEADKLETSLQLIEVKTGNIKFTTKINLPDSSLSNLKTNIVSELVKELSSKDLQLTKELNPI